MTLKSSSLIGGVWIVAADVGVDGAGPGKRPDHAHFGRAFRMQFADALDATHETGFVGADVDVVVQPLLEHAEHVQDLLALLVVEVAPHSADAY